MRRLATLALLLILALTSCAGNPPAQEHPFDGWVARANLDAEETPEELYAAALNEDMLVVCGTSTRMMEVVRAFEARYEGLIVKFVHAREGELCEMLEENYANGESAIDLVSSADARGRMTAEFLPRNIAVKYVPWDMADSILPGNNGDMLMYAGEAPILQYNSRYYAEPPVSNWWELTEEKWRGMVYMPNPENSSTTLSFLSMMVKHGDEMAEAYESLYGTPLAVPDGENAGMVFMRRLVENDVVIVNSSNEAVEMIGAPGSNSPAIGIVISSKMRMCELGYEMAIQYDMEPATGVYAPISIMMAGGAKNVNAAKLFIRFLLGEADGQGEGAKPYLQSGTWSVRSNMRDLSSVRSEELNLWHFDREYAYNHCDTILNYWASLLAE